VQAKVTHTNRGHLFSKAGSRRLKAEFVLSGRAITITADGEARRYPIGLVDIQRYDGNIFEVTIGDHVLFFDSDFPLRFTFEFIPALEAGRRKRANRDRPSTRRFTSPIRPRDRGTGATEPTPEFDEPADLPWTDLALGRDQARLLAAVAARPGHTHTWQETRRDGDLVQMCTECRQVLIDLSDRAVRPTADH
jgi:hypothetical protein